MKIKVIVNPNAGKKTVQKQLERIIGKLLLEGVASSISVTATRERGHATEAASQLCPGEYDLILTCGGDGTINEVLNGLIQSGSHIPIAILAAGTSNDFAASLNLPDQADAFCRMVKDGLYRDIDIGCANGRYFINVASFGMFTGVAHSTDQERKNLFGKLAYYLQGVKDAPVELTSNMPLHVSCAEYEAEANYHICLVSNSTSVGSMRKLMYKAEVDDGKFDVLLMRKHRLLPTAEEIAGLQPTALPAQLKSSLLLSDPLFIYFQTERIEFSSPQGEQVETDLDGELFGTLPLTVEVCPLAVSLLVPQPQEEQMPLPKML